MCSMILIFLICASCSWTFQESEVEGCEYQDDTYVHCQPFPGPALEEQEIDRDDHDCHQDYVECRGRLASHFNPLSIVRRWGSRSRERAGAEPMSAPRRLPHH